MAYEKLFDLSGKVTLLAGGGELGMELAAGLAEYGARLVVMDVDEGNARATAEHVVSCGGNARSVTADILDAGSLDGVMRDIRAHEGGLDIMVNAVGAIIRKTVAEQSDAEWERIIDLNLTGAMRISKAVTPLMRERGAGKIVHLSSAVGLLAYPGFSAYASSKAGLNMLVQVLAMELAPHGINVNGIAPGTAITRLNRDYYAEDPSRLTDKLKKIPANRLAERGDFVGAVIFLSSAASDYVQGVTMAIDGGRTISG